MDLHLELPGHARSASMARAGVREVLAASLGAEVLADLTLVVSELVANAVRQGPGFEHELRRAEPDELGGRGLPILAQLSCRWGVFTGSSHVWFELLFHPGPASQPAPVELGAPPPDVLPDAG